MIHSIDLKRHTAVTHITNKSCIEYHSLFPDFIRRYISPGLPSTTTIIAPARARTPRLGRPRFRPRPRPRRPSDLIPITPLHQAPIVIHQHLRLRHDPPFHAPQKLQFQEGQLLQADAADAGVEAVGPEGVAETFARDGGAGDEEAVDGERGNGEGGV